MNGRAWVVEVRRGEGYASGSRWIPWTIRETRLEARAVAKDCRRAHDGVRVRQYVRLPEARP